MRAVADPTKECSIEHIDKRLYIMQQSSESMVEHLRAQELAILSFMHLQLSADETTMPVFEQCEDVLTQLEQPQSAPSKHAASRQSYWSETVSNGLEPATSIAATEPASDTK